MKRTPLKRRSKSKALVDKVDRKMQNWYRSEYKGTPCEGCGKPFDLIHHCIEKSKSNFLRFNQPDNFIFLCKGCHFAIHRSGDSRVMLRVKLQRGDEWVHRLLDLERLGRGFPLTVDYLNEMDKKYTVDNSLLTNKL